MPTYEFRCPDGTIVERVFKISEVPEAIPSPNGDGMAVRVISGGAGLIFKGSGFYITDYGKDGKKDQRSSTEPKAGGEGGAAPAAAPSAGAASASAGASASGGSSTGGASSGGSASGSTPAAS